jgi:T-complex protein 1 subunit eta
VLRGGSEQFIDEAERSLHDAIMIVRRALKHAHVVAGGGAIDMEVGLSFVCGKGVSSAFGSAW